MAALRWLVGGHGYDITGVDVLSAYTHTLQGAENAGRAGEARQRSLALVSRESFVTKVLGRHLGLS